LKYYSPSKKRRQTINFSWLVPFLRYFKLVMSQPLFYNLNEWWFFFSLRVENRYNITVPLERYT
ncbi:hypothetical protein, partial [Piscibacillus salipiscarius]